VFCRQFLHILDISTDLTPHEGDEDNEGELQWDVEWMAILQKTHSLLRTSMGMCPLPKEVEPVTDQEYQDMKLKLEAAYGLGMHIPNIKPQQVHTRGLFEPSQHNKKWGNSGQYKGKGAVSPRLHSGNIQTDKLLAALDLPHIWTVPSNTAVKGSISETSALAMFSSELIGKRKLLSLPSPVHSTENEVDVVNDCGNVEVNNFQPHQLSDLRPPPPPLVAHSNSSIILDSKSSVYDGWYPPLPSSPPPITLSSSSSATAVVSCEYKPTVEDPNALDI